MMQLVRETSHPADDGTSDANQEDAEAPNSTSAPEYCHLCGFAGEHKLFRVKGGHLECSMCLQADLLRQIRAGSLPLQTKFVLEQGFSPYDLLPAILPLPVFNMYTKMMYSIILTGLGLTGEFIDCPNCQASLYIKDPQGEEGELPDAELIIIASVGRYFSCGHCNHHWCHDCNDVPHLSMTCEQFVEWKPKWRTQCAIENLEGFEPAFIYRIRCSCGRGEFDVSMPSSYASCPHCKLRIDPGSMEEIHQVTKRLYGRDRGRTIYGNDWYITKKPYNPLHVERIASQPQIRKEVAKLCAEARQQRFDKKAYNMMLSKVRELKRDLPDIEKLPEAYKAALLLVENVNGWMYISKRTDDCVRRSLANVTKLRQKCIEMLSSDSVDNEILAKSIRLLEDGVHSTIRTVAERLKDVQRNETNRV